MNKKYIYIFLSVIVASAALFVACSSNSSNPVVNTNVPTFSFTVGNSFQFKQWTVDSTGKKIEDSLKIVHETFVDSGFTIGGQAANVFVALDSVFDSTNTHFILADSAFYTTDGVIINEYGLIASIVNSYDPGVIAVPLKWNILIDAATSSTWLTDTTTVKTTISSIPITIRDSLNGANAGDTMIIAAGDTLNTVHAHHSGKITANSTFASAPLSIDMYMSFTPTVMVKFISAPTSFGNPLLPSLKGLERDLITISLKK